jgi:serine/threonine-protein kinase
MDTVTPEPAGRDQRLDEVLADYLRAAAAGREPRRQALLDQHPDLAPELAAFLDDRERFDRLAAPLRTVAAEPVVSPGEMDGYELEAEIARGGVGVVWKARQKGLNRTVALKMLRAGVLAGPAQLRRFQAEAEAVAALDHPRIVPVYEVGEHNGQPYLAMKYLEGGSLADGLDRFRAEPRAAARLMAEVADAVHHAHQHGVLHRDLKPANILLDAGGRPHVSDFGLAKRLIPDDSSYGGASLTQTGDVVGTPSYMAPEQARGDTRAVTVATDVYGLGAILYELLAGQPPFRGDGILDTLNRIQEQTPVAPRKIRPGVDRDLETICLKALEKEPARRYGNVELLADDLRRFLAGEPIQARAVGPLGRGWRWCRRQPVVASLLLALASALVGGYVAVTWQWRRAEANFRQAEENFDQAERERERAEENFRQAHDVVSEFCVRLSDNQLNGVPGLQPLRRELLGAAVKYYEQFLTRKGDDPMLRNELAGICRRLGTINAAIGKRDEAQAAFDRSLKIMQDSPADTPQRQGDLARTRLSIALLQLSDGQLAAALASFEEAEKGLKQTHEATPGSIKDAADYASVLLDKGLLCARLGRMDEARSCYERQIALLNQLLEGGASRATIVPNLAAGYLDLGSLQSSLGNHPEAAAAFEKARALLDAPGTAKSASDRQKDLLASSLINLGGDQLVAGQGTKALATLERSRSLLEKLTDENPDVLQYVHDLSSCLRQTGHVHRGANRTADAFECYERAKSLMERLVRQDPAAGAYQNDLAKCLFDLGGLLCNTGKDAEGLVDLQQSAALRKKLVAVEPDNLFYHSDLGLTLGNVALVLSRRGRPGEGLETAREAVAQQRLAYTGAPRVTNFRKYLAGACGRLADLTLQAGNAAEAVAAAKERRDLVASDGSQLYACARTFARAAELSQKNAADNQDLTREYDDLALGTLALAIHANFKDADKLRKDLAWARYRDRAEFTKLVAECGK